MCAYQVLLSSDPTMVVQHFLRLIGDGDVTALLNQCRNGGLTLSPIEAYFFTDAGLELEWRRRLFWSSLCAKINKVLWVSAMFSIGLLSVTDAMSYLHVILVHFFL